MTQQDKELLLRDLCARVPYHPRGRVVNNRNGAACDEFLTCATFSMFTNVTNNSRLYLRPMSSMTEEEFKDYDALFYIHSDGETYCENWEWMDWMNAHHFDFRNLIEKGLALKAPTNMYKPEQL